IPELLAADPVWVRACRSRWSSVDSSDDVDERGERFHLRRRESQGRGGRACAAPERSRARRVRSSQHGVLNQGPGEGNVPGARDCSEFAEVSHGEVLVWPRYSEGALGDQAERPFVDECAYGLRAAGGVSAGLT